MNISNWPPVRLYMLPLTFYFLGLSTLFGECQMNCQSSLEISLDQTGNSLLFPSLFIIDSDDCTGQKDMLITNSSGQVIFGNSVSCMNIGQTLVVKVTDTASQASCWTSVTIADNSPPKILNCVDQTIFCNTQIPFDKIGEPTFDDNCSTDITFSFTDQVFEQPCDPSIIQTIERTWLATNDFGNQGVCTHQIIVKPITLAGIEFPEDIMIEASDSTDTNTSTTGFPTFNDDEVNGFACQFTVSVDDEVNSFCGNTSNIYRTFTVIDWCTNNQLTQSQSIDVIDTMAPTINCNGDTIDYFVSNQLFCFADVSTIEIDVTDNSDFTLQFDWDFLGIETQVPLGLYNIAAIATDDCNNKDTCDFFIRVLDRMSPIALCESNFGVPLDSTGFYTLSAIELDASSQDNCGSLEYFIANDLQLTPDTVLTCENLEGPVTLHLVVVDESGNPSSCTTDVSVFDVDPPTIICPDDITIKCFEDAQNLSITGAATATDNCQQYTPNFTDNDDLNVCNAGTIDRTFSVFENNIAINCLQLITLEIDSPSVVFPVDITINCGFRNELTIVGQPVVTAMCPGFFVDNNDEVEIDSNCNIVTTREWKVFDTCLDTIYSAEQIITEIDTIAPVITKGAIDVSNNCTIEDVTSLDNWLLTNGGAEALDICSEIIWTNNFSGFDFDCSITGATTVIFTATDLCGNSVSTTASFTVVDTTAPIFTSAPIDITLDCELDIQQEVNNYLMTNGGATGSDACGQVQLFSELINPIESLCRSYEVLTTVTDACGLMSTATSTITIVDDDAPELITPPMNIEISCDVGDLEVEINTWVSSNGNAVAVDLCGTVTWTHNFDLIIPMCGEPIEIQFTATDECGNSRSVSAEYTVVDDLAPILLNPATDITIECDGNGNIEEINDYLSNNGFSDVTDNCSEVFWTNNFEQLEPDCEGTGFTEVEFTATDLCGNTVATTASITIVDTTPPRVIIPVQELTVECDGFGNIVQFNNWVQDNANIAVEDICSEVEFTFDFNALTNDCGNAGFVFTVFVAADQCSNTTILNTNFIIEDTTPPVINCPPDLVVSDEDGDCTEFIILPPTTAFDVCNGILFFSWEIDFNSNGVIDVEDTGPNASGDYGVGIHTVSYFVEDECGNVGVCQQIVEVQDNTGLGFSCVDEFLLGIDATGSATLVPESIGTLSTCFEGTTSLSQSNFTCDDCGINEVSFILTDAEGNSTACTTNVFVCDNDNNCSDCIPCNGLAVGGVITTETNFRIAGITINAEGSNADTQTNSNGEYYFEGIANQDYSISPYKNDEISNGVTTLDLISIQRHILGVANIDSPYQSIAADANNSGSITTLDLVDIQRVILQINNEFTNNTSWRFVEEEFVFIDPSNPFSTVFPELISINGLASHQVNKNFIGIKIGDVNNSFTGRPDNINDRNNTQIPLVIQDQSIKKNEIIDVAIQLNESLPLAGYQFTIGFDPTLFEFITISDFRLKDLSIDNFGLTKTSDGLILANWVPNNPIESIKDNTTLFSIQLKAKSKTRLADNIWLQNDPIKNEGYVEITANQIDINRFELNWNEANDVTTTINNSTLFQNAPNPFTASTQIEFYLPEQSFVDLQVYDPTGREVWSLQRNFDAGKHEFTIHGEALGNDGVYIAVLKTAFGMETIKMVYISN